MKIKSDTFQNNPANTCYMLHATYTHAMHMHAKCYEGLPRSYWPCGSSSLPTGETEACRPASSGRVSRRRENLWSRRHFIGYVALGPAHTFKTQNFSCDTGNHETVHFLFWVFLANNGRPSVIGYQISCDASLEENKAHPSG